MGRRGEHVMTQRAHANKGARIPRSLARARARYSFQPKPLQDKAAPGPNVGPGAGTGGWDPWGDSRITGARPRYGASGIGPISRAG